MKNQLYYGDNLKILREYMQDESVDLIYLDPPFNSNRSYNVLFKDESGQDSEAQLTAFEDTWHWDMAAATVYEQIVTSAPPHVASMIGALREFIGTNQMTAYIVMMTARLLELHRVLKPTGSLYLHCDPTASHYLKIVLDSIFGMQNFKNEISWKRSQPKSHTSVNFPNCRDIVLRYTKSDKAVFNKVYGEHDPEYIRKFYKYVDQDGRRYRLGDLTNPNKNRPNLTYEFLGVTRVWRWTKERMQQAYKDGIVVQNKPGSVPQVKRYLDSLKGQPISDNWDDIEHLHGSQAEALGYPTQKPVALLERILAASSNPGDVVLDPFCGCGTTIHAAQKLKRKWIGIDITHLAIALQKYRLKDAFGIVEKEDYEVIGEPESLADAKQLASDDRYQFQWWALSLIQAQPVGGKAGSRQGKKGKDKGIDGIISFIDEAKSRPKRLLVQVKSGKVKSGDIRDLVGTIEREKAALGVFITLEPPTRDMKTEAASAGFYHSSEWNRDYAKIQILTIEDLLAGAAVQMPGKAQTYKQAQREKEQIGVQRSLQFGTKG